MLDRLQRLCRLLQRQGAHGEQQQAHTCRGCGAWKYCLCRLPVQLAGSGNDACGEGVALQVGLQDARVHARHLVLFLQACEVAAGALRVPPACELRLLELSQCWQYLNSVCS